MAYSQVQIKTSVRAFITQTLFFNDSSVSLDDGTSFLETGLIDSTGILELTNFLQKEFSIKIEDNEMLPENLDSLDNIAGFIAKKQGPA